MAYYNGVQLATSVTLPDGLSGVRIAIDSKRGGTSLAEFAGELDTALAAVNAELINKWGDLVHVTTENHLEYEDGGDAGVMVDESDLDTLDGSYALTQGHHIDLRNKGDRWVVGATMLRDMRREQIDANIRMKVRKVRNTFEKSVLTRFFLNTSTALAPAGYAAPFANASNGFTWTPPSVGGNTFASTHTHYNAYNTGSSATFATVLNGLAAHLAEHSHEAPYIAMISETDVATISALTNFIQYVAPVATTIDRAGVTSGNQYFATGQAQAAQMTGGRLVGFYQTPNGPVEIRATARIPTLWVGMYKSYGINDPRNPMYVRIHEDVGFGVRMYVERDDDPTKMIKAVQFRMEYGVAAGRDRTVGAAGYLINSDTYTAPTIS